jgi:hypothetical protein
LIAAISIEFQQEREQSKQGAHQQHTAIPVLDVGRVDALRHLESQLSKMFREFRLRPIVGLLTQGSPTDR